MNLRIIFFTIVTEVYVLEKFKDNTQRLMYELQSFDEVNFNNSLKT